MSTYLDLVNRAILESGQDIDQLSALDFATPSIKMQERFKHWVAQSWKDIQMQRDDWHFKTGRATVSVKPAIYVENSSTVAAPVNGDIWTGQESDFSFTVDSVVLASGTWGGGNAKATIYFTTYSGADFRFGETFDSDAPESDIAVAKGWGRYDFNADGQVSDLREIILPSVMIQDDEGLGLENLTHVDWYKWIYAAESYAGMRETPQYFTTTPDGALDFWPRPDKEYKIHFTYTRDVQTLVNDDDEPNLPEEYRDGIMWRAVMMYAEYNEQPVLLARATRHWSFYKGRMEKSLMPIPYYAASRYDYQ